MLRTLLAAATVAAALAAPATASPCVDVVIPGPVIRVCGPDGGSGGEPIVCVPDHWPQVCVTP